MAVQSMTAYKPGAPAIARVVAHDLEGYYYVLLSLAFMFHSPYVLKAIPQGESFIGTGDHYLKMWLENKMDAYTIWQEAEEKRRFFCTHEGFQIIEGRLGTEWSCEPIKVMLREMRELLFYSRAPVTHLGMINIIERALHTLSTDHEDLCKPVPMTEQWLKATGSPGPDTRNPLLPALRVNVMYHQIGQGKVIPNLFARMPRPPEADVRIGGSTTGVKKGTGVKTIDRVNLLAPPMDLDVEVSMAYAA
jgi:hypothetical protein